MSSKMVYSADLFIFTCLWSVQYLNTIFQINICKIYKYSSFELKYNL